LRSRYGESFTTMKNCDPPLSGSCARAMDTIPRLWEVSLNSAFTVWPGPPVPCWLRGALGSRVFGSPPWIMKPGMTRWNVVPS
jgi:hypothetical protein